MSSSATLLSLNSAVNDISTRTTLIICALASCNPLCILFICRHVVAQVPMAHMSVLVTFQVFLYLLKTITE